MRDILESPRGLLELSSAGRSIVNKSIYADAAWQRYFLPTVLKGGNELFMQTVSKASGGNDIRLHLIKDAQYSSYVLKTAYGGDDHNVGMSVVLPSGRVMTTYCNHGEATGVRYKVTNQTSYPYTLSAERTIPKLTGFTYQSYSQVFYLSDGTVRVFSRAYNSGTLVYGYAMFTTTAAAIEAGTEVWTQTNIYQRIVATVHMRPYPCIRQNPSNMARLDFFIEGANIAEGSTDIGHMYLDVTSGDNWYKTDGTLIVSAYPFDLYAVWTLADAVSGAEDYLHVDAGYDAAGRPRALLAFFPTGGSAGKTDIIFKMSCWNGSAWRQFTVGTLPSITLGSFGGTSGSGTLDTIDKNRMWLSETVGGIYQVREYRINQDADTATYVRTVSNQRAKHDFRPFATGLAATPVAFIRVNNWTSYTDFDSSLVLAGGAVAPKLVADWRLTETSGQTLADSSGNGLDMWVGADGTATADLAFVTNGVSATGVQGAIMKTGAPADLIGTNFYFAVVANTTGITGAGTHVFLGRDDTPARHFVFRIFNGNLEMVWRQVSLAAVIVTGGAVTTGSSTFRLFSGWMKDGQVKLYVNGVQSGSTGTVATPFDANTATAGVCLASRFSGSAFTNTYPGTIAAARIYRDVYDEADLAALDASIIARVADKGIVV